MKTSRLRFVIQSRDLFESSVGPVVCPHHDSLRLSGNCQCYIRSVSCVCRVFVGIWTAYVLKLYQRSLYVKKKTKRVFSWRSLKWCRQLFCVFEFLIKDEDLPITPSFILRDIWSKICFKFTYYCCVTTSDDFFVSRKSTNLQEHHEVSVFIFWESHRRVWSSSMDVFHNETTI